MKSLILKIFFSCPTFSRSLSGFPGCLFDISAQNCVYQLPSHTCIDYDSTSPKIDDNNITYITNSFKIFKKVYVKKWI